MRVVAFRFSGASTQSWTPDKSGRIKAAILKTVVTAAMSQDPSLAVTDLTAPGVNDIRYDLQILWTGNQFGLDVQVRQGQTYFIVASGPGTCLIYLDP